MDDNSLAKKIADSYELANNVLEYIPNPLVSIRTSAYNHGPYIKQCIEGVLMQRTNFPLEYIIGEDFSNDETREIVFEYAKKYPDIIRVITADYNVGSRANGRRCIQACRGKYMAICEGDDYWIDPLKLQKQVDFLENNVDYALVYTNYKTYYAKNGNLIPAPSSARPSGNIFDNLLYRNFIVTATVLVRTDIYNKAIECLQKYNQSWKLGDYPLWLEIARQWNIKYLLDITTVYRVLPESASHFSNEKKMLDFNNSVLSIQYFFVTLTQKDNLLPRIEEEYYTRLYLTCIENKYGSTEKYRQLMRQCSVSTSKSKLLRFISKHLWLEWVLIIFLNSAFVRKLYSCLSKGTFKDS